MINITFPDGAVRQYENGVTALDVAKSISEGLARKVIAANVNGKTWDATRPINEDATVKLLKWEDAEGKSTFWHSTALATSAPKWISLSFTGIISIIIAAILVSIFQSPVNYGYNFRDLYGRAFPHLCYYRCHLLRKEP